MAFTFITVLSIREEEVRDCKKLTQLQNQIRCEQERQRDLQAKALKLKQINFTKDPAEVNRYFCLRLNQLAALSHRFLTLATKQETLEQEKKLIETRL